MQEKITADNLQELLAVLPSSWQERYKKLDINSDDVIEFVVDLGRKPLVRLRENNIVISSELVTYDDLDYITDRVGDFGEDNRAGIDATLHRISVMRNRRGRVVGLTARVGRAIYGYAEIIRDIIKSGRSILLLGKPGVGKTTILREIARVLSDEFFKRVVIVDTSNEIAGDGDIPHAGVGSARRLQVASTHLQHNVMIEAVENHTPEVVIIDEIGTEAEAYAARTIAERGVMLVATAHGIKLENLMRNPTLSDLVGGIESVTLSDEVAFKRGGGQKAILERKAPPTFDVVIELRDRNNLVIHKNVANAVDAMLRGSEYSPLLRTREASDEPSEVAEVISQRPTEIVQRSAEMAGVEVEPPRPLRGLQGSLEERFAHLRRDHYKDEDGEITLAEFEPETRFQANKKVAIFPASISTSRLDKLIKLLCLPARIVDSWQEAEICLALKGADKKDVSLFTTIYRNNLPVYFIKENNWLKMKNFLEDYFSSSVLTENELARIEVEEAIKLFKSSGKPCNLLPQNKALRRMQVAMITDAGLRSICLGSEKDCYVRIYGNSPRERIV